MGCYVNLLAALADSEDGLFLPGRRRQGGQGRLGGTPGAALASRAARNSFQWAGRPVFLNLFLSRLRFLLDTEP